MPVTGIQSKWSSGSLVFNEVVSGGAPLVSVGEFVSAATGSGMVINNTKTKAFGVYADDGGVALGTSAVRAAQSRLLITVSTATAGSAYAHQTQLKIAGGTYNQGGHAAGLWGYLETISGVTITGSQGVCRAGVVAMVDVPSGATIDTTSHVSCIGCGSQSLGGTHTGSASVIHVTNPGAGTFDAFLALDTTTGCITASALSGGTSQYLKVLLNNKAYTILMTTAA